MVGLLIQLFPLSVQYFRKGFRFYICGLFSMLVLLLSSQMAGRYNHVYFCQRLPMPLSEDANICAISQSTLTNQQ